MPKSSVGTAFKLCTTFPALQALQCPSEPAKNAEVQHQQPTDCCTCTSPCRPCSV